MLRFFRQLREAFELRRLRAEARRDPSPRAWVRLCRSLESRQRYQDAITEARQGLARFPHAHDLAHILRTSFDRQRVAEAAKARLEAGRDPALDDLCEIVRSYIAFTRLDEALRGSKELLSRFPGEADAHLMHGIVCKALFNRDHASRDGKAALVSLKRAVDLDATSLEARRSLAETYAAIGATSQAVFHALLALELAPHDAETNKLYTRLRNLPLQRRTEGDLLWEAEENDQSIVESKVVSADRGFNQMLVDGVRKLSRMPAVRRVAMRHRGVAMVATPDYLRPASERSDRFLAAVEGIRKASSTWSKRVGMGGFEEATLRMHDSTVLAVAGGGSVIALELVGEPDLAPVAEEARNLVASFTASEYRGLEWVR